MDLKEIDNNATGALYLMAGAGAMPVYGIVNLDNLGAIYVMWQTGKNIKDFLKDENIPDHHKDEKIKKINLCKKTILENYYTDTTVFGMRKNDASPIVITDGIHRAIGIYRAMVESPLVKSKVMLRMLLFTGEEVGGLEDYKKSIESNA